MAIFLAGTVAIAACAGLFFLGNAKQHRNIRTFMRHAAFVLPACFALLYFCFSGRSVSQEWGGDIRLIVAAAFAAVFAVNLILGSGEND